MAAHGWGTDRSVKKLLYEKGYRFDFYQAVKLLEILHPEKVSLGERSEPEKEALHFKAKVSVEFPASEINEIAAPDEEEKPAEMSVNFMGLAGAQGPMPMPYTELILERVWHKDRALRDFLDIFNHRLISLMYRARKTHRIGFDFRSPDQSHFARYLFSLIGLGTEGLLGRMKVRDRALLFYTAFLTQQPRSMIGLEYLLSDYLGVKAQGIQFCGQWHYLEEDQTTSIGVSGQNQILGQSVVVGTRVWDQQGIFEIHVGPLSLKEFMDFLPTGDRFTPLCQLILFYVGDVLSFYMILLLKGDEVPESRLGRTGGPRLGWTSWLKTRDFEAEFGRVRLSPRFLDFDGNQL